MLEKPCIYQFTNKVSIREEYSPAPSVPRSLKLFDFETYIYIHDLVCSIVLGNAVYPFWESFSKWTIAMFAWFYSNISICLWLCLKKISWRMKSWTRYESTFATIVFSNLSGPSLGGFQHTPPTKFFREVVAPYPRRSYVPGNDILFTGKQSLRDRYHCKSIPQKNQYQYSAILYWCYFVYQLNAGLRDCDDELVSATFSALQYLVPVLGSQNVLGSGSNILGGGEGSRYFTDTKPRVRTSAHSIFPALLIILTYLQFCNILLNNMNILSFLVSISRISRCSNWQL